MQAAAVSTVTRSVSRRGRAPEAHLRPVPDVAPPRDASVVRVSASKVAHTVLVSGEIDFATGSEIVEAVDRVRARHPGMPIIVDTSAVEFIDPAGYRALRSALSHADRTCDPLVSHVVGAVVLRLEVVLELVSRSR